MDWYLLRYFLAVAELGNFSRAATKVNVTQPTLSSGIVKLETQLGHRLFNRDKRRVSLTPVGSRFLVHAQRISHEYNLALQDIAHAPASQVLRVGVLSTIPTQTIEDIVVLHKRTAAAENIEIVDGTERELKAKLDDEAIDIALTILRPGGERFKKESLFSEPYVLIVSQHHRLAHTATVSGEELAEDAMIIRRHCEALAATSRYFTERGVRPRFGLKTTNDDRALALVRTGLGVTVMPESFRDSGIRQIRLAGFDLQRQIGLIYSQHDQAHAQISSFAAIIRNNWKNDAKV